MTRYVTIGGRQFEEMECNNPQPGIVCIRSPETGFRRHVARSAVVDAENPGPDTPRHQILAEADRLVHSDRNKSYGEPTGNFENTAALWNTQFSHKLKEPFTATDVALALIQLKLARIISSPKRDNWADILGYAACGFECDVSSGAITDD